MCGIFGPDLWDWGFDGCIFEVSQSRATILGICGMKWFRYYACNFEVRQFDKLVSCIGPELDENPVDKMNLISPISINHS